MKRRRAEQGGRRAERLAALWLQLKGWKILGRRVRTPGGEVDLVARRGRTVAFVEVKTRRTGVCGAPLEAVGPRKRDVLARVAALWRLRYGRPGDVYRFDLIGVWDRPQGPPVVEHVADAWRLGEARY